MSYFSIVVLKHRDHSHLQKERVIAGNMAAGRHVAGAAAVSPPFHKKKQKERTGDGGKFLKP